MNNRGQVESGDKDIGKVTRSTIQRSRLQKVWKSRRLLHSPNEDVQSDFRGSSSDRRHQDWQKSGVGATSETVVGMVRKEPP